jgi:hypothetical protein
MKRRWITSVYLSLAVLPACQVVPPTDTAEVTSEVANEVTNDVSQYCGAQLPQVQPWDGKQPAPTDATEIYLFYQETVKPRDWIVYRVDYGHGKIPYGARVPIASFGRFVSTMDLATQYAGGRQPVPPLPVGQWDLAAALLQWGALEAQVQPLVEQAGVCDQQ